MSERGRARGGSGTLAALCAIVVASVCLGGEASGEKPIPWPTLHIPKLSKPPVIDGKIDAQEWAEAAAITGFHPIMLDEIRSQWYVGYDDEWLYFAMHSPHFPGTWPAAKGKPNPAGDSSLGWDAHVEMELSYLPRTLAYQKGFYIIHINPRDAVMDQHYNWNPGQAGYEWQCERRIKSTVNERVWDMEVALRRTSLSAKPFDNTEWIMHLVRADGFAGAYFFAWKYSWYVYCHEFPAVFFDPQAPSFRFLGLGEIRKGQLDAQFEILGKGQARPVALSVRAVDSAGKTVYEKAETMSPGPGERKPVRFQSDLQVPDKGMSLEIRAYTGEGDKKVTLYEHKIPGIMPWTKADEEARAGEIERRKHLVTSMNANFAYYPSAGVGRATVDNDIFGMPDKIASAPLFRLRVNDRNAPDKALAATEGKIDAQTKYGEAAVPLPDLPAGDYTAAMELVGADGGVVDKQTFSFARRTYPWEGNSIGKERIVIPPFTPLAVEGSAIRAWNRVYEIGKNGLVRRLINGGENILRDPVRLESEEEGKAVEMSGRALKVIPADVAGHTVLVESEGSLGSVPTAVHGNMEYDGFYLVTLDLKPQKPTTLGKLDLVIPLWSAADMAVIKRSDGLKGSYMGALPAGEGVVWDSRKLLVDPMWGTFAPICFVGTGDKGIFWEAESMDGWNAKPESPCVVLERVEGAPQMRIRMFHEPTLLDKPRTIRFALWASPSKPMRENWRSIAWHYPESQVTWFAYTGYRFYGDGVNSFTLPSDEHYLKLRQSLMTPASANDKSQHRWWSGDRQMRDGKPLLVYGSNMGAGMAMKELETYCGEWTGGTWPENPTPECEKGMWNTAESIQFNEPRQLCAAFVNVCDSYIDCYLWYHQKYVRLAGVQGTWWDNASTFTTWTPEKGTGRPVYKWNNFQRREFVKRLATMCWLEGKEPYWMEGMGAQLSFNTICWMIENDFYLPTDTTFYEYLPMDQIKPLLTSHRGLIPWMQPQGGTGSTPELNRLCMRSWDGVRLLHDIGAFPGGDAKTMRLLEEHFGFFDNASDVEFIGYWRTGSLAQFRPTGGKADVQAPYVSIYRNNKRHKCLIVIANGGPTPLEGSLWLNRAQLLPNPLAPATRKNATLFDIEANKFLGGNYADRGDWYDRFEWNGKMYETDPVKLPARDHRLLVFE